MSSRDAAALFRLEGAEAAQSPAFQALLALYQAAIPVRERHPDARIVGLLTREDGRIWGLRDADSDDALLGFAIVYVPPRRGIAGSRPLALLEYTAVDPALRGCGLGGQLLDAVATALKAEGAHLLAEVEDPREPGLTEDERAMRQRRLRFYQRLGWGWIRDLDYVLPLVSADPETPPPPMILLDSDPDAPLSRADLATGLEHWFTAVYGCSADDPRIVAMLGPVADPVARGPLSDLIEAGSEAGA